MASINNQPMPGAKAAAGLGLDTRAAAGVAGRRLNVVQGGFLKEAATCGCAANKYLIEDPNQPQFINVKGKEKPYNKPIFMATEESSCCCRAFCAPCHPHLVEFYHAKPPVEGKTACGVYSGHTYPYEKEDGVPPFMVLERDGLCTKCHGCFICCPGKCADQAWMHHGNPATMPQNEGLKPGKFNKQSAFVEYNQTTECCVPIVAMGPPGAYTHGAITDTEAWAYATGPCFFGGCMDLCTTTTFGVNPHKSKSNKYAPLGGKKVPGGEFATIQKDKPKGLKGCCMAVCSDVDTYTVEFNSEKLEAEKKAAILGEVIHLDYMFFEKDRNFCAVEGDSKSGCIYITLCTGYCRGNLCPIVCCIPYGSGG